MRRTIRQFFNSDFPNCASHCHQEECGFSIHRGVLVQWDEDHDIRILGLIDELPPAMLPNLLLTQEHEGSISFLWAEFIPKGFEDGGSIISPGGDSWSIYESKVAPKRIFMDSKKSDYDTREYEFKAEWEREMKGDPRYNDPAIKNIAWTFWANARISQ